MYGFGPLSVQGQAECDRARFWGWPLSPPLLCYTIPRPSEAQGLEELPRSHAPLLWACTSALWACRSLAAQSLEHGSWRLWLLCNELSDPKAKDLTWSHSNQKRFMWGYRVLWGVWIF